MNTLTKVFVGVDVSLKTLDIYIHPVGKYIRIKNSTDNMKKLLIILSEYQVEQIVCESSGGYENLMYSYLQNLEFNIWRVQPQRIKAFIASEGIKYKTDKIDAKMIALFSSQKTRGYTPVVANDTTLVQLLKRKSVLTEFVADEKRRVKHPSQLFKDDIQELIQYIQEKITSIEQQIEEIIKNDDVLNSKNKILQSVPGVGRATASMLLAALPELGKVHEKQVSALAGVAPYVRQSGQYRGIAKISSGRFIVRKTIYMAALTASRSNPVLSKFYNKLIASGKKPKVALVAVMHKLIIILNALLKNNELWKTEIL